ncbi:hypothetical protein [Cognatishimia sp.]|uniref:hypothetical protein n=1 Tax=Cognatishimia sp. TaxID=2211648 RepID=UPI003515EED4
MQGWLIFKHAVAMLWGNKGEVLQIALAPILIATILILGTIATFSDLAIMSEHLFDSDPFAQAPVLEPEQFGSYFTGLTFYLLLSIGFTIWVIVAWHRFILLNEQPNGWVPPFNRDRMWAYFIQVLKLFGVGILIGIPLTIVFVVIGAAGGGFVAFLVTGIVLGLLVTVLFVRWSLILPAAAIGKPLSLRQSFNATKGAAFALIVAVVLVAILQFCLQFVAGILTESLYLVGVAVNLLIGFAIGMLNASILTTLYGHYVEGREL